MYNLYRLSRISYRTAVSRPCQHFCVHGRVNFFGSCHGRASFFPIRPCHGFFLYGRVTGVYKSELQQLRGQLVQNCSRTMRSHSRLRWLHRASTCCARCLTGTMHMAKPEPDLG